MSFSLVRPTGRISGPTGERCRLIGTVWFVLSKTERDMTYGGVPSAKCQLPTSWARSITLSLMLREVQMTYVTSSGCVWRATARRVSPKLLEDSGGPASDEKGAVRGDQTGI